MLENMQVSVRLLQTLFARYKMIFLMYFQSFTKSGYKSVLVPAAESSKSLPNSVIVAVMVFI